MSRHKYSIGDFLTDILSIIVIVLIIEACGCHPCRFAAKVIREAVNTYHQTIHPSDLR